MIKCEICKKEKPVSTLTLKFDGHVKTEAMMFICDDCKQNYDFTIGAIDWDEEK